MKLEFSEALLALNVYILQSHSGLLSVYKIDIIDDTLVEMEAIFNPHLQVPISLSRIGQALNQLKIKNKSTFIFGLSLIASAFNFSYYPTYSFNYKQIVIYLEASSPIYY